MRSNLVLHIRHLTDLPFPLYRILTASPWGCVPSANNKSAALCLNDLKLHGVVLPVPVRSSIKCPNGMTLRPPDYSMVEIVRNPVGNPMICSLNQGLLLPKHFRIYLECSVYYSLQSTECVALDTFSDRLTKIAEIVPQFLEMVEDEDDQDF